MFWSKLKEKLFGGNNSTIETLELSNDRKSKLEKLLGFNIDNEEYYIKALTHRSYLETISHDLKSNERLEFLGDSVLGQITAEFLFKNFPKEDEGFLTKTRSHIVNTNSLVESAKNINLTDLIFIEKKFKEKAGEGVNKISADAMEAIIAAVYLDKGLEFARRFVHKWILSPQLKSGKYQEDNNFKGKLLELTHLKKFKMPVYKVIDEVGPEHDKIFTVDVLIDHKVVGTGKGKNKKSAEQEAAKCAMKFFSEND